jgi:hypothetical protein
VYGDEGKVAFLKDPLSDLKIMKLAFTALQKSVLLFVSVILNNCWLEGDEELRDDEKYANGLEDQIQEITDIPDCEVERDENKFRMTVDGMTCEVRMAKREDILQAEQRNRANEPFETAIALLKIIGLNGVEDIRKSSTRTYIGLLAGVDKVKNKAYVRVEKL